ncbi:MAG: hypothetical protein L0Y39_05835 [Methylococcaceae bacterium]|nr:hypothetical protein [Methylococcaceae bacterium]
MKYLILLALTLGLSGCASFGEGIATAFLEKQESEDLRLCQIIGKSFEGIAPTLKKSSGTTKVLMVHGVGSHIPGYSSEFLEKLSNELSLGVKNRTFKEISLTHPAEPAKKLGTLRVHRQTNETGTREMLFYELTWSAITADEKSVLSYDNSGEFSYRRALVNDLMKKFSNDTGPDPMIYLGESHDDILMSFRQSLCWMIKKDWESLPETTDQACSLENDSVSESEFNHLITDDFAFVSHSLGSRITIDGMQQIAENVDRAQTRTGQEPQDSRFIHELKKKEIPLYMLSNQLPLLQMGRKLPEVHGKKDDYCSRNGSHYADRIVNKTTIIAFSDPNDLLSYAIPQGFVETYLDSRLCIDVVNVNINVAEIIDLIGLGEFANPVKAHTDYDSDDRVVALVAKGIGNGHTARIVDNKCKWIRVVD